MISDSDGKKDFLIPENVRSVENSNMKYVSMYFDEEEYGMESYSFGEILAGRNIMVAKTKFQEKTCACKTSGTFLKGFFLIGNNEIQRIKINKDEKIINRSEVYNFFDKYSETGLPKDIYTVNDIVDYINTNDL